MQRTPLPKAKYQSRDTYDYNNNDDANDFNNQYLQGSQSVIEEQPFEESNYTANGPKRYKYSIED